MSGSRRRIGTAAAACGLLAAIAIATAAGIAAAANDPRGLDADDDNTGRPASLMPGPDPMAAPSPPVVRGNPLWGISLKSLSATRDRPLFSPSRRPPPRAVLAPLEPAKVAAPPEPEKPPLDLLGVVTGNDVGYAVFMNTTTHDVVSLRTGEGHDGWILQSVSGREAVLEKDHRTAVMALPEPSDNKQ